jgi:hypothetical protein
MARGKQDQQPEKGERERERERERDRYRERERERERRVLLSPPVSPHAASVLSIPRPTYATPSFSNCRQIQDRWSITDQLLSIVPSSKKETLEGRRRHCAKRQHYLLLVKAQKRFALYTRDIFS